MNRDHQNHGAKLFAGKDVPRRDFLRGAAVATGATGAMGIVGSSVAMAAAGDEETDGTFAHDAKMTADENGLVPDATTDITYLPRRGEYPTPSVPAPDTAEYSCDVLVVGGGLAGLNAAWAAAQAGSNVILVEKATPGYGGLSAWPSCTAFYDPELDADMDLWDQYDGTCVGAVCLHYQSETVIAITAKAVVLATGNGDDFRLQQSRAADRWPACSRWPGLAPTSLHTPCPCQPRP